MTNRYGGYCERCGGYVPAGAGTLEKKNGRWVVTHAGSCPEITSGLGIGGHGSDDYNIHSEPRTPAPRPTVRAGQSFAPTGTTNGIRTPGKKCARCGQPANWNSSAGEYLCDDHWDEY